MVLVYTKDDRKVLCAPHYFVPNFPLGPKTVRTRLGTRQHCKYTPFSIRDSRNLKQQRRRRQRERQKTIKHWLCTCDIDFGTFLCRPLQNNDVK